MGPVSETLHKTGSNHLQTWASAERRFPPFPRRRPVGPNRPTTAARCGWPFRSASRCCLRYS